MKRSFNNCSSISVHAVTSAKKKRNYERKSPKSCLRLSIIPLGSALTPETTTQTFEKPCSCGVSGSITQFSRCNATEKLQKNLAQANTSNKSVQTSPLKCLLQNWKFVDLLANMIFLCPLLGLISNVCTNSKIRKELKCFGIKGTKIFNNVFSPFVLK